MKTPYHHDKLFSIGKSVFNKTYPHGATGYDKLAPK